MASRFPFLPLGPRGHRIHSVVTHNGKSEEDDWHSVSSHEASSPTRESKIPKREGTSSFNPVKPEEEQELLQYMPSLFHKVLPPCGAEVQIAYLRIVGLLRERWLVKRGRLNVTDLCRDVKTELELELEVVRGSSHGNGRGKRVRKPWRRENVFRYELCWANYFYREARTADFKHIQNVDGTGAHTQMHTTSYLVPAELKFVDLATKPQFLRMWIEWNKHRDVPKPQLPVLAPVLMDMKTDPVEDVDLVEADDDKETTVIGLPTDMTELSASE